MLNRRVNFVEAEVAHIDPFERKVSIAYGQVEGKIPYDYLIFALGRRRATERITGFYEHAHHLLNADKAIQFGKVVAGFNEGRAILGHVSAPACRCLCTNQRSRWRACSKRKANVSVSE